MLCVESLSSYIHQYRILLIDIYGVIYDGKQYYPNAIQTLIKYKILGKKIVLLSNYPRDAQALIQEIQLNEECYNYIWTSGDYMRHTLCKQSKALKFFFINNHEYKWCTNKETCKQVDSIEECDFIVLEDFPTQGMYTNHHLIEEYAHSLKQYHKPLICLNSEKTDIYGSHNIYQIGELAYQCQQLGMHITYLGKPESNFYKTCLAHCNIQSQQEKILAIGDNLYSDISGCKQFGFDTAIMTTGIYHNAETISIQSSLTGIAPTYISMHL